MRANSMNGRALLVLLPLMMAVGSAGSAEAGEYIWVRQSTQPAEAILAPGGDRAVCRMTEDDANKGDTGSLYVGWFHSDRGECISGYGGSEVASAENLEFLVLTPAPGNTASWVNVGTPLGYDDRYRRALSAGMNTFMNLELVVCSVRGYVSWITWPRDREPGRCNINLAGAVPSYPDGGTEPTSLSDHYPDYYILTGTVVSIYD